ncbi:sporulation inhibitor of replication protein SirA [Lentibacillus juripiscarius]|uniref:Sporulation inhibitor of replication protein SirA n=1 Tax=Lentibacillus juripiscarius TaxID=257446 RepID=A0ABW5V2V1_9BACI
MNHYSIYWIREEFAHFFYYRSEILCRFIKSYEQNQGREDLVSQFQYITHDFPQTSLIAHIIGSLPSRTNMKQEDGLLKVYEGERYISLHMERKRINFRSDIIHDAEELLFPALRSFQPYLFVVGNNTEDFGWISPVIQLTEKDKPGQVLYSCL